MSKTEEIQSSAIKILDYLYFYDIVAMETFSNKKLEFYEQLSQSLKLIVQKRQYEGLRAEHYKHLLLFGIDLEASCLDDPLESLVDDNERFIRTLNEKLCSQIVMASFSLDEFEEDLNSLLDEYSIALMDSALYYKIISQFLCYEFDNITIGVLIKFLDFNFLELTKYKKAYQNNKSEITQHFLDKLFFRAMLYLEFEAFKNELLRESQKYEKQIDFNNLDDAERIASSMLSRSKAKALKDIDFAKISKIDLCKTNALKDYVINIESRLGHNAIFSNGIAKWISLLGAWHLMRVKKTNLDKTLYRETPVSIHEAEIACSEIANKEMLTYGFSTSERNLRDWHNVVFRPYESIRLLVDEVNKEEYYGILEPILTDYFFYDPMIGDAAKNAFDKFHASFKK